MPCKSSKSSEMEGLHIERDVESSRESQNAKVLLWHWLNTRLYWQGSQIGMLVEYGPRRLLTRVSKWNSHPKISIVYCGNTFFLLCEQHFGVSINWVSNWWYKRKFQQLWNTMASQQDSDIVFVPNENIALCMLL